MPERRFTCIHDASGETKDCTLAEWPALQAQGYRIVDAGGYQAAVDAAGEDDAEGPMAEQGRADASAAAAAQYPEAKPAAADKPKAAKKGE